jgi:alanyl-tRNA synthetase
MFYFQKEHQSKGLKAIELANLVAGLVNGKSGGKDDAAQGAGSDIGRLGEVLKLAEDHIKKYL